MTNYRLTHAAESDFEDIGRYTQNRWGAKQRRLYLGDLVSAFERLADNPNLGRDRKEIRDGLRGYICNYHVIFFRLSVDQTGVEIIRILHGRQSLEKAFGAAE